VGTEWIITINKGIYSCHRTVAELTFRSTSQVTSKGKGSPATSSLESNSLETYYPMPVMPTCSVKSKEHRTSTGTVELVPVYGSTGRERERVYRPLHPYFVRPCLVFDLLTDPSSEKTKGCTK
jgi:hypothetical protein